MLLIQNAAATALLFWPHSCVCLVQNQLNEVRPPGDSSTILGIVVRNEPKKAVEVGILEFDLMLAQWLGNYWLDYLENE